MSDISKESIPYFRLINIQNILTESSLWILMLILFRMFCGVRTNLKKILIRKIKEKNNLNGRNYFQF